MKQVGRWTVAAFAGASLALLVAGVMGAFGSEGTAKRGTFSSATATIVGSSAFSGIRGTVTFTQTGTGPLSPVQVVAVVQGLPPGKHGMHIHEKGLCTPTTGATPFTDAGIHFDPGPNGNSSLTNHPFHAGDLPNLDASPGGIAVLVYLSANRFTVDNGPSGILDTDGSAVVIHATPDLYAANLAGGARIACGVVK